MPKSRQERYDDYLANKNHPIGSEGHLTEEELEMKIYLETLEEPNHPINSAYHKLKQRKHVDKMLGKVEPRLSYRNIKG